MDCITIRFYAELNDFISIDRRHAAFEHCFNGPASVKDVIESLGVPHTEVDLILINSDSAPFSALLKGGESVTVYPVFKNVPVEAISLVRPEPLSEYRFVLDSHLGKLAAYLRMLGFDTLYRNDYADPELAAIATSELRILLTSDRGLLKRSQIIYGYCIRDQHPGRQLIEVLRRFDLFARVRPFQRCMSCNGVLISVPKEQILSRLPAKVADFCNEFHLCPECGRIYWQGTHYKRMREFISNIAHMDVF